jgi:hypothetical protein
LKKLPFPSVTNNAVICAGRLKQAGQGIAVFLRLPDNSASNALIVIFDPNFDKDIDTGRGGEYKDQESESLPTFMA